ncbi:hypothetical protein BKI52_21585 [marine bacterium AO1-C]|nr:hypothetical protein BKI52_21585 [marine bacterium AO1-C]
MKKKQLKNLSLNKKVISKLDSSKVKGGSPTTDPCLLQTKWVEGCTRPTIDLSYCPGLTIPNPCLSTGGACA